MSLDRAKFLITYCQEYLPFELMENRPQTQETQDMDEAAYHFIAKASQPGALDEFEPFLKGLYKVLIGYAKRRLPADYKI